MINHEGLIMICSVESNECLTAVSVDGNSGNNSIGKLII